MFDYTMQCQVLLHDKDQSVAPEKEQSLQDQVTGLQEELLNTEVKMGSLEVTNEGAILIHGSKNFHMNGCCQMIVISIDYLVGVE